MTEANVLTQKMETKTIKKKKKLRLNEKADRMSFQINVSISDKPTLN